MDAYTLAFTCIIFDASTLKWLDHSCSPNNIVNDMRENCNGSSAIQNIIDSFAILTLKALSSFFSNSLLPFLCSYALVYVEIKNEGEDAFKREIYGDVIVLERRISESTSSTVLKDHQGFNYFLLLLYIYIYNLMEIVVYWYLIVEITI